MKMSALDTLAMILVVIGALNWGVMGILDVNVVESILGLTIAKIVYILVGLGGLLVLWKWYAGKK